MAISFAFSLSFSSLSIVTQPLNFQGLHQVKSLALAILSAVCLSFPVEAAERIYFNYNSLNLSLQVEALELFAKEGKINKELEFYLQGVSHKDKENFRKALQQTYNFNSVQISRFFRTSTGEKILENIGNLITIPKGINGKYAIRGALIQAANHPEGLSILGFLRSFPTDIQLDTGKILQVLELVEKVIQANQVLVKTLDNLSEQEAFHEPRLDFSTLPDISQTGKLGYQFRQITVNNSSRKRQFYVHLYYPQTWPENSVNVIIISHGLASRPEDYDAIAKHLATYGYLIAIPQHIGSDFHQVQEMLAGYSKELFQLQEFIDRPLDVSYLLDELERRNKSEFQGKLNLKNVGAIGHSLGGYTVLALAGGQINFDNLKQACYQTWSPNPSLLIQCRALDLPKQVYNLRDKRIKSIIAVNPINSGLFGSQGLSEIKIPVFLIAGSQDPATPLVLEQGQAFNWLKTPDKYLGLVKGQAHINFSKLDAGTQTLIKSFADLTLPEQWLIDKYDNTLMLAFFEIYLRQNQQYRPYLQASYADYISQKPFEFYLINSSSDQELKLVLNQLRLNF